MDSVYVFLLVFHYLNILESFATTGDLYPPAQKPFEWQDYSTLAIMEAQSFRLSVEIPSPDYALSSGPQ